MLPSLLPAGAVLLGATQLVAAQSVTCSLDQKCPEDKPCCSQYGQCGTGAFCLGGCDPRMSFSLEACVPAPVCQDKTYKWDDPARIADISEYRGDPTKHDWVSQGYPLVHDDNMLLTMPRLSGGTVMATTNYIWYGKIHARLKSGRGAGVVTAFILYSDVKDEIDYEFVGTDLSTAQTNYYFQGIPDYTNSENVSVTNTFETFHDYEIEWTPEYIKWFIDGKAGRTKVKADTFNKTSNQYDYPQTPSRLQISIWPGGNATNAKGTIDWAGGPIDWNSQDIRDYGYNFATFGDISVQCHDAKDGAPGSHSKTSYVYKDAASMEADIEETDRPTVIASLAGTGMDRNAGGDAANATDATVPESSSDGPGQNPGSVENSGSSPPDSVGGGGGDGGGASAGGAGSAQACDGFCQGTTTAAGGNQNNGVRVAESRTGASAFAVVVGFAVLLLL